MAICAADYAECLDSKSSPSATRSKFHTKADFAAGPSATPATTYACNPAHSYPNGASCISTQGGLRLVTASASATATGSKSYTNAYFAAGPPTTLATTYGCNPAHSYPNGASCISTQGRLTLITASASATTTAIGAWTESEEYYLPLQTS
ncbi:hypothetical protein SMMN14_06881 [Sphaerulina musiva]